MDKKRGKDNCFGLLDSVGMVRERDDEDHLKFETSHKGMLSFFSVTHHPLDKLAIVSIRHKFPTATMQFTLTVCMFVVKLIDRVYQCVCIDRQKSRIEERRKDHLLLKTAPRAGA
jgi:hypothetical protein